MDSIPKNQSARKAKNLRPGDLFNPYGMFNNLLIPETLARYEQITPGAKLCYGRLRRYAGKDGRCYPTTATLATEIGVRERQAQRYLAELEGAKLVRRIRRHAAHGGLTSNAYVFLWHSLFEDEGVATDVSPGVETGVSPGVVSDVSPKEGHSQEGHLEEGEKTDLDCLARNRKNRDSAPDADVGCVSPQYPRLREELIRCFHEPGQKDRPPSDALVVKVLDAACQWDPAATEDDVVRCLVYLHDKRGLRPGTKNGPRHWAWFPKVVGDYFEQKRPPAVSATMSGALSKKDSDCMTSAIEIPQEAVA